MSSSRIEYSEKYADEENEYRWVGPVWRLLCAGPHVILPKELAKTLPKTRLLSENEWRSIGVQQSRGWQHYAIHRPEPHILLFRRPLGTDPQTGAVDPELKRMALEEYKGQFGLKGN
ncbi:hypothetical protein THAOC_00974 [Thalassiosira oceanica]|uniref:Cyclin-dependent kinases regulatory subunit n=1 Tax=Thalassiosira oceanica TaxID=159749 RepID=K0TR55_THAOC|nr:hypothetical protein THAOC_00974 [Thalassiosira oceanica]|eukprot:EJK77207.1 hypothetical protein THAOC_00974 [Thalassiosira oceanica]